MSKSSSRDSWRSHLLDDLPQQGPSHYEGPLTLSCVHKAPPNSFPVSYGRDLLAPRTSPTGWERSVVTPVAGQGTRASGQETGVAQGVEFLIVTLTPLRKQGPGVLYNPVHRYVRMGLYRIDCWGKSNASPSSCLKTELQPSDGIPCTQAELTFSTPASLITLYLFIYF